MGGSDLLMLMLVVFGLILAVVWVVLPFAVFGIKARLDETNRLLGELLDAEKSAARGLPSVDELIARRRDAGAE